MYDFLISQPSHQSVNQYLPNRLKNRLNTKKIKMIKKTQCLGRFLDLNVKVYRSWKSDDWGLKSNEINTCETSWILHWLTNLSTKETQWMKGYSAQCNSSTPECGGKIFLPQLPFKLDLSASWLHRQDLRWLTEEKWCPPLSYCNRVSTRNSNITQGGG